MFGFETDWMSSTFFLTTSEHYDMAVTIYHFNIITLILGTQLEYGVSGYVDINSQNRFQILVCE